MLLLLPKFDLAEVAAFEIDMSIWEGHCSYDVQEAESCVRALWHRTWVVWCGVRQRHLALSLSFPPNPLCEAGEAFPHLYLQYACLQWVARNHENHHLKLQQLPGELLFRQTTNHYSFGHSDSFSGSQNPRKGFCPHTFMSLMSCRDFISVNKIISLSVSFFCINISGGSNKRLESLLLH